MLTKRAAAAGAAGTAAAACGNSTDERKLVHQLPVMPLIGWTRNLTANCVLFLLPRFKMQSRFPSDYSTRPEASPAIRVLIRSARGSGARIGDVEVCATGTIADVKQLLCLPPHSICSDASMLVLVLKGRILAESSALSAVASLLQHSAITAIIIAPHGACVQTQKESVSATPTTASYAALPPPLSSAIIVGCVNGHAASLQIQPPSASNPDSACSPSPRASPPAASATVASAVVQQGSRVRIEGMQTAPDMNGRTGTVCRAFDHESGRWHVQIDSDGARPACLGAFRAVNLKLIPSHNFSTEWLDENGRVWPKIVDFSRQCAKGHPLAALGDCGVGRSGSRLMCRICHSFCERDCGEAAGWLMCSVADDSCGYYAVCSSCGLASSSAAVVSTSSDDSSTLGVGLQYLSWLRSTLGATLGRISTSQFCQMYVRPFTSCSRRSLTQQLVARGDTAQHVGDATWFISHTWNNVFADTLDSILLFFEGQPDAANAKLWFDVLVTSQHETAGPVKPSSFWMNKFKENIAHIGRLLLVVDAWDNPTALRRAWCVLELHAIAIKKQEGAGRFEVVMTATENQRFLASIAANHKEYYNMLGRVDAETSDCSRVQDRQRIHEGIQFSVGFAKLNRMVFGVMESWMEEQLRQQISISLAAGRANEAIDFSTTLAIVLHDQGRLDEAAEIRERILVSEERGGGPDDPRVGQAMGNLAVTYLKMGRLRDALPLQQKTLRLLRRSQPRNDEALGRAISNLASTCEQMGTYQESLMLREEALEIFRRTLPDNHPDLGDAMNNLAHAYSKVGRLREALDLFQTTLVFRRLILTENHPQIGTSMGNVASTYSSLGMHHEALELKEKVLYLLKRSLPPDHPDIGTAIGSLASTCSALGRLHDALALQQDALEFNRRVLSENHPNIGLACYNVSSIYAQTGEYLAAKEFMHEALRVWMATLPPSHPRVLLAQEQLRKIQENLA